MHILNDLSYPESYIKACESHSYRPKPDRRGVTALIDSPQITRLLTEEWDNIVVPASDFFVSILGTAFHKIFEGFVPKDHTAEKHWEYKIGDITLAGKADLTNGGIEDYKLMSAWSWVFDKEKHFAEQLNILNRLRQWAGEKPAEFLRLHCFIKDWTWYDAQKYAPDYPKQKYFQTDLDIWPNEKTEVLTEQRLKLHLDHNYKCSEEEKWIRTETFCVMRKGCGKAIRGSSQNPLTYAEAEQYILEKGLISQLKSGIIYIEQRRCPPKRCLDFCIVRSVCPYAKGLPR